MEYTQEYTQWIVEYLVVINLLTFGLFGFDKWMANAGAWRISEKMLWLLSLVGGSIGALTAMQVFRHKTRKVSFQFWLILIIVIQCAAIISWLYFFTEHFFTDTFI